MYQNYFDKFIGMSPYLYIDASELEHIKNNFDKQDVKESLAKVLMTYEPPFQDISLKDAKYDFRKLKGVRWNDLFTEQQWFARSDYQWPLSSTLIRRLNAGNMSSNYFQQKNRWGVDSHGHPGPLRTWATYEFMTTLMGSVYSLNVEEINKTTLRSMLALRKYICSQFKPSVAKAVYDFLQAETILDFSAGWGDRLAGFYASDYGKLYVGIDPKSSNHPLYLEQSKQYEKWLTMFEHKREARFIQSPAEDADLSAYADTFDVAFTSPPYFNVERYSDEETQSWVRYKQIDDWNKNFLHRALKNVWKTLKPGGSLLVNISDVSANSGGVKQWQKICDPMNYYIETLPGAEFVKCVGMQMAIRPNSIGVGSADESDYNEEKEGDAFGEPVWWWRKN